MGNEKKGEKMEPEIVGNRVMKLIKEHKMEIEELAKKMNLKQSALKGKLEGKEEFYLEEMMKIKNIFQLDTKSCDELFFQEPTESKKNRSTK